MFVPRNKIAFAASHVFSHQNNSAPESIQPDTARNAKNYKSKSPQKVPALRIPESVKNYERVIKSRYVSNQVAEKPNQFSNLATLPQNIFSCNKSPKPDAKKMGGSSGKTQLTFGKQQS